MLETALCLGNVLCMWEMSKIFRKWLKYVGNGSVKWKRLKYVGNDLDMWEMV